jgi:hypothetical protein
MDAVARIQIMDRIADPQAQGPLQHVCELFTGMGAEFVGWQGPIHGVNLYQQRFEFSIVEIGREEGVDDERAWAMEYNIEMEGTAWFLST